MHSPENFNGAPGIPNKDKAFDPAEVELSLIEEKMPAGSEAPIENLAAKPEEGSVLEGGEMPQTFDEEMRARELEIDRRDMEGIMEIREKLSHFVDVGPEIGIVDGRTPADKPEPYRDNNGDQRGTHFVAHTEAPESQEGREDESSAEGGEKMSRRGFLRNTAHLGVMGFFRRLGFEVHEKDSALYKKNINELHEKSLSDTRETEMMYVKGTDGTESLSEVSDHETNTSAMTNIEALDKAAESKPEKISLSHNHPLAMIRDYLDGNSMSDIDPRLFQSPPSTADLMHAYGMSEYVKKKSPDTKMDFNAVDHNGVWSFDAGPDSAFAKMAKGQQEFMVTMLEIADNEPKFKEFMKKYSKRAGEDPRILGSEVLNEIMKPDSVERGNISKKSKEKLEQAVNAAAVQFESLQEFQRMEIEDLIPHLEEGEVIEDRDKLRKTLLNRHNKAVKKYIKLAEKLGAKIEFKPISKFK